MNEPIQLEYLVELVRAMALAGQTIEDSDELRKHYENYEVEIRKAYASFDRKNIKFLKSELLDSARIIMKCLDSEVAKARLRNAMRGEDGSGSALKS